MANPFSTKKQPAKKASSEKGQAVNPNAVLKEPHMTEKAVQLGNTRGTYVFKVSESATKGAVKDAVEEVYGVDVERVRMITIPRKRVRFRMIEGVKGGYKKALVSVAEGQKIDILPV